MKTTTILKHSVLTLTVALCLASCKKDKKADPAPPTSVTAMSISDLKALSTSASVTVPDNRKINGTVISDISGKNIDSKTIVLQQSTGQPGIVITFPAAQTFAAGDSLEVLVSKQTLAQVNGEVILQNVPTANATKLGTGSLKARVTTAAAITQNAAAWDGTLATIPATGLTGGNGKFSGALTVTDASGSLNSDILAGATYENTAYPVSVSSFTGIVRVNGTTVSIETRKAGDVITGSITKLVIDNFTNAAPPYVNANTDSALVTPYLTDAWGGWGTPTTAPFSNFIFPGSKYDASFLTPSRNYFYFMSSNPTIVPAGQPVSNEISTNSAGPGTAIQQFPNNPSLAGLKQVSVTFAGSTMSGQKIETVTWNVHLGTIIPKSTLSVETFDPNSEYLQIAILPIYNDAKGTAVDIASLATKSAKITQLGKFFTLTWNAPTKDQLVAAGMTSDQADSWLAYPIVSIANISSYRGSLSSDQANNPIIIDNVTFGF